MASAVAQIFHNLLNWVKPEAPGDTPTTVQVAMALTDRVSFSSLLSYRDYDDVNKMVFLESGSGPSAGFILQISPVLAAGMDLEAQLEAIISACPPDSVIQFGVLSTPQIRGFLNSWYLARTAVNTNPILAQIAKRRYDFMLATAGGPSMLPKSDLHPRNISYYVSVRIPYKGDATNSLEIEAFVANVRDLRNTTQGALSGAMMASQILDGSQIKFFIRELLNPHISPDKRVSDATPGVAMHKDLVDRNSRITITKEGFLGFASNPGAPDIVAVPVTVDTYPDMLALPLTSNVLGSPTSWEERITAPFWAYTTIHVLDADKSREALTTKLGALNKQTMTESAWFRSMMGHLFERKDNTDMILKETHQGHALVRMYSGINLYCPPDDAKKIVEQVKGIWRRSGFKLSEEKYIALPAFIASLPLQYTPSMDPPNRGLQRATLATSLNAASAALIQGDWYGTSPGRAVKASGEVEKQGAGPLFVSRRGQLACFDLLETSVNYNFIIAAASGSGKSFLAQEIVTDFLSKNGIARIIDVGRSYWRFCEVLGGTNMVFSASNPVSLNPFYNLDRRSDLDEMLPMLKAMLRQMAYPLQAEEDTPAWEYAAIEAAISGAWETNGKTTELSHVYHWLLNHNDKRAHDLAFQLEPFAVGRYGGWFNGPRLLSFDNNFIVVELEELKQDPELQSVVLTLIIHQVTTEMYLSGRERPKLLAIDEAWDLLGGVKTGKFIETAFRRARKYNGIAGVITQSFEDFERSPAAKAAIENAAWQFILHQRPESLEFAAANKRIVGGDGLLEILKTVRSGPGFSEVYVRGESGSGLYRFVTDRHTYYTFTTNPKDINRITTLTSKGHSIVEAIDILAKLDYQEMWGADIDEILGENVDA